MGLFDKLFGKLKSEQTNKLVGGKVRMGLIVRAKVTPSHAQVWLMDIKARDIPQWKTRKEKVVANPQCVAVATQSYVDGDVVVEVWLGSMRVKDPRLSKVLFDGKFLTIGDKAVVGNELENQLYSVPLKAGWHRLRVFTSPMVGQAKKVYFFIT